MAAGMARVGDERPVNDIFFINNWQGVDGGPQGNDRILIGTAADIGDDPGALGQDRGMQPGAFKALRDPASSAVLCVTDLGMRMQVPPELDQLSLMLGEKRV